MAKVNRFRPGAAAQCGSIVCEEKDGGNLRISKVHSPSEAIVIQRADVDDLMVALDGILSQREDQ